MISRKLYAFTQAGLKAYFGQNGEDILIKPYLKSCGKAKYLDLGAYHPFRLSNTALLWIDGWSGVNVDANLDSIKAFREKRPNDLSMHGALITSEQKSCDGVREVTFFKDASDVTKNSAGWSARGSLLANDKGQVPITVPALTVADVLSQCDLPATEYLNIDLEGMDELILREFDFVDFRPTVISVEDHQDSLVDVMVSGTTQYLCSKDYKLVSRGSMASIFVKK